MSFVYQVIQLMVPCDM